MRGQPLLAPRFARAQHIEADSRDDCCQPSCQVIDSAYVGAVEAQPSFLNCVVGFVQRAEHSIGYCLQMAPTGLESLNQYLVLVHRSHSQSAFREHDDEWNPCQCDRKEGSDANTC